MLLAGFYLNYNYYNHYFYWFIFTFILYLRGCIENTIKYCNEAEVKCPYRDSEYTCESTLQEREIKAVINIFFFHMTKKKVYK